MIIIFGVQRDVRRPVLPLLLAVGGHQLDVHVRAERAGRDGRHVSLRHQRLFRLFAVVGRPARPVCRPPSQFFSITIHSINGK